ncbi:hypothetical protein AB0451_33420 [Streptomyces sp. NPDC052000]|uniref:hypothetical protein n=1 Tax=Streptomyces sp. NPDC052000 TaxID=3155676 RepID=UPI0034507AE7
MRARTAVLVAAAVLVTVAAGAVPEAGHWRLYAERHRIELRPRPRRSCPDCRAAGGWWVGGLFPEMEACGCWTDRRELSVRLRAVPDWPDEPSF